MVCPLASDPEATGEEGSYAAFANSRHLRRGILGCEAVGGRAAVDAKYRAALDTHHTVVPVITEVFGGVEADTVSLLNGWAARARGKTPPGEEPPWCARNYVPYWSQILSKAVQTGAAEEILTFLTAEANKREARSARGD